MSGLVDLSPPHLAIVEEILSEHVPDCEVRAFGSRATRTAKDYSDLDLAVLGDGPLDRRTLGRLKEAFEESTLPMRVNALDWHTVSESLRKVIERDYVVLSDGPIPKRIEMRLGDVCTKIGSGATPRGGKQAYVRNGPYSLIRSQNVHNAGFSHDGLASITQEQARSLQNVEVLRDDVLLNITGDSVARVCQVDPLVLPARVNQHVAIIRPDASKLDPEYLRYYLAAPEGQSTLLNWAGSGGTRNALTKFMIESFVVDAPAELSEQRAITRVLGVLDDKIALNRRMSETLDEMGRALFKSWFVDFDPVHAKAEGRPSGLPPHLDALFPDSFEPSELGPIPAGWRTERFGTIVDQHRHSEHPFDSPATVFDHYSIPAYDATQTAKEEAGEHIKSAKLRVLPGTVLLSRLNPEIERVWLSDVTPGDRAVCSTEFMVLEPRQPIGRNYVYCLTRSPSFRRQIESLVTGTSRSHQRARPEAVLSLPVLIPPASLGVLTGEVVPDGGGWSVPVERAVGSVAIVVVQEAPVGVGALGFAGPGSDVGPFLEQGAVEAFDLAVGLGPVGAGLLGFGGGAFAGPVPGAAAVAGPVVGQDAFAVDAPGGEPALGAAPEVRGGLAAFVVVDLAVHQAAVVVEGAVQVAVAGFGAGVRRPASTVGAPAAAGGNARQLLDVHVDQLARGFAHVPLRLRGGAVADVEAPQARLVQDRLHCRGRQADPVGDPGGAPSPGAQLDDPPPGRLRCARRAPAGPAGAIGQAVGALVEVTVAPLARRLGADLEPLGGRRDRPTLLEDHRDHLPALAHRQLGVAVLPNLCHEPSLRAVSRQLPTASPGGLTPPGTPQSPQPRDNVPGCHT